MTRNFVFVLLSGVAVLFFFFSYKKSSMALPNGFTDKNAIIDIDDIHGGGPPRDGIPAILRPKFEPAGSVSWLRGDDEVISLVAGNEARAYPLRVIVWHEIVNDKINGRAFTVTYCPLCGSAIIFESPKDTTFGVSGLLYQSDVLMYDHQTKSLWSQLMFKSVVGQRSGERLSVYPSPLIKWKTWAKHYPKGKVLSKNTGFNRNYSVDPYRSYRQTTALMFPVKNRDTRLDPKARVFVVLTDNAAKAYPLTRLKKVSYTLQDNLSGTEIKIRVLNGIPTHAKDATGENLKTFNAYWFAWYTFQPNTLLYQG